MESYDNWQGYTDLWHYWQLAKYYLDEIELRYNELPFVYFSVLCSFLRMVHSINLCTSQQYIEEVPFFFYLVFRADVACYGMCYYNLLSGIIYDAQTADLNFNHWHPCIMCQLVHEMH